MKKNIQKYRAQQREIAYYKRAGEREIGDCPPVKNWRRRRMCGKNPESFCNYYFPHIFFNPFTRDQRRIISDIRDGIFGGEWKAIAAARGDGKTTIAKGMIIWAVCYGYIRYGVIISATGELAKECLDDIKVMIEVSDIFFEDWAEIAYPVRCLEGASQRARMQTSGGERTFIEWGVKRIVLPQTAIKGAGHIISTCGIDGAIRGLSRGGWRPDFCFIDDPQTMESAYSITETEKRKRIIERDIGGLAGPTKRMSMVLACTIIKKGDLADTFTDRAVKPAWYGIRQKFLLQRPEREDLWEKYIEIRQTDQIDNKGEGRSNRFYENNREEMDKGAEVNNPYRFDIDKGERSALQHIYNKVSDFDGWDYVEAEYQNNPPDEGADFVSVDIAGVCRKVNNIERGLVPVWVKKITMFCDVHDREIFWIVVGWGIGMIGGILDYGIEVVNSPDKRRGIEVDPSAVGAAIFESLNIINNWQREKGFTVPATGEVRHVDLGLVDCGYMPEPVISFCRGTGGLWKPARGRSGKQTASKKGLQQAGLHITGVKQKGGGVIWEHNPDYFKKLVQEGFLVPEGKTGSISLYGSEPIEHREFANHIVAEVWQERISGKKIDAGFVILSKKNHYLDCLAGNAVAARMLGLRILEAGAPIVKKKKEGIRKVSKRQPIRTSY